jgi:peptide/nickel transport system substrate-binding protein
MEVELKSVVGSVFFSSDTANPDTYPHFYCDMQMYTTTMPQPDPQIFMNQGVSWEVATKENKWQGRNVARWQNKQYDAIYRQAERELDPVKRAAMYIRLNEILVGDHYIQPIAYRPRVTALSGNLTAHLSGWDNDLWQLASWYREG